MERIYRHPLPVRLWHWSAVLAVGGLLFTGFNILNIHPRLYWGEVGNAFTPAVVSLDSAAPAPAGAAVHPSPAVLRIGSHAWDVTGYAGSALDLGPDGMYFLIVDVPDSWHFGAMRAWHFACAWLLFLSTLGYVGYLLASGRLARRWLPSAAQLAPRAIGRDLLDHLRLRRYHGEQARDYNLLQKLAYLLVLFVLLPAIVLTGLTMSNAVTARLPELYALFGGRQSARTLHALGALLLAAFVLVHVFQLFVAGFTNGMRSMITGRYVLRSGGPP